MKKEIQTNRRDFLNGLGKAAAGAAVLGAVSAITGCSNKKKDDESQKAVYPWKYVQLTDLEGLKSHTYDIWFKYGGCGAGALGGILEKEAEAAGTDFPYNVISGKMIAAAHAGWGTGDLCGAIAGGVVAMGLFVEPKDIDTVRDKLYAWYRTHAFPQYRPEADKYGEPFKSTTTVANSILCKDSVGNYMKATGYAMKDDQRKCRCAGLTAEVVVEVVHILNVYFGYEKEEPAAAATGEKLGPNEYIGTANSEIGGELKVKVTMNGKKIANVEVLSHKETAGVADPALKQIPEAIVKANSADVDVVTGASKTSQAIMAAVKDALKQVK